MQTPDPHSAPNNRSFCEQCLGICVLTSPVGDSQAAKVQEASLQCASSSVERTDLQCQRNDSKSSHLL